MEAQPRREKQNTGGQAFTGSAVVGGAYVCTQAYTYFLSE